MEQNTPVTLNIRPESFDLLMGILELNGKNAGDEDTRLKARYLLEKWRRFSRLPGRTGNPLCRGADARLGQRGGCLAASLSL